MSVNVSIKSLPLCTDPALAEKYNWAELEVVSNADLVRTQCPTPCQSVYFSGQTRTYETGMDVVRKAHI
jgi:hypothetical protein